MVNMTSHTQEEEEEQVLEMESNMLNMTQTKPKKISTRLDFAAMAEEFQYNKIWGDRTSSEIWKTFGINFVIGLLPTIFDVGMDSLAINQFINGDYYYKATGNYSDNCRLTESNRTECFEKDPIFGYVTLTCFFLPGFGFSFWTFISLSNFLRGTDYNFRQNVCFFLFFVPLSILSAISFPFQLLAVNIVSLINGGAQWTTLTAKYSIAESLYDASIQFCIQLFIVFSKGDREPSTIQYLAMSGSLLVLSVPRIEAWLLDQGGVTLPIKEKLLKMIVLFPVFFFNSIFKLGCIGLISSILRYNAITLYAIIILLWTLMYILFNERCLPQKYYYLIHGALLHAVSIGKIPYQVKNIETHGKKHHKVTSIKLTSRHQMQNIFFQNILWFILNTIILVMLIILTGVRSSLWTLWPIVDSRYSVTSLPITKFLPIIVPVILTCGILDIGLIYFQLGIGETESDDDEEMDECDHNSCDEDPSLQGKIAKKLEPVMNVLSSATDVEI